MNQLVHRSNGMQQNRHPTTTTTEFKNLLVRYIGAMWLMTACTQTVFEQTPTLPTHQAPEPSVLQVTSNSTPTTDCVALGVGDASHCASLEANILASTVRVVILSRLEVTANGRKTDWHDGYATVKDGRYLVTHNHFGLPLSVYDDELTEQWLNFVLFRSDGRYLMQTHATAISLVGVGQETLIFDFGEVKGIGLLEQLGLRSAEFSTLDQHLLTADTVIGQIDWDGKSAHVNWAAVDSVTTMDGTDVVRLDSCIKLGASGGGVFLEGEHIGNNWTRQRGCVIAPDRPSTHHSTAALNEPALTR